MQIDLTKKIPNFTALRAQGKSSSHGAVIDQSHPLHNDPLVDVRTYSPGLEDSYSYYSRPNKTTGKPLPGIPDAPLVRSDIAKRLAKVNEFLMHDPSVAKILGAQARVQVADALRPFAVQKYAYEVAWPQAIKARNPGFTPRQVAEEVKNYCAKSVDSTTPTPHITGGAVDIRLINMNTSEPFYRGHAHGNVLGTAYPDFHEGYHLAAGQSDIVNSSEQAEVDAPDGEALLSRRVLYNAVAQIGGLYVNPREIWHYGLGDPLSTFVAGKSQPYYGVAELPEWYSQLLTLPV